MELIDKEILNEVKKSIICFAETIKEEKYYFYEVLISNWNLIERLFLEFDINYTWPMSKDDFCSKFDLNKNKVNSQMHRFTRMGILNKGEDYVIEGSRGPGTVTYIFESGAKKTLEKVQSIEGAKFLRKFGTNIHLKKCFLYITIIKYAVKGFDNPIREYTIRNPDYRIDLYLKQKKLAIECDELGHEHESPKERDNRGEAIKKKLECELFRFNPHDKDVNIGEFIHDILCILLGREINGEEPISYCKRKWGRIKPPYFIDLDEIDLDEE